MNDIANFLTQLSNPILTLCAIAAVKVLIDLRDEIQKLNVKVAVVIERVDSHEKRITNLET